MMPRITRPAAVNSSVQDNHASELDRLTHERVDLGLRISDVRAAPAPDKAADVQMLTDKAVKKIEESGRQAAAAIDAVADSYSELTAPLRKFMLEGGIDRPVRQIDPIPGILMLMGCFTVEAAATTGLLVGDGSMGLLASLMTGTIFSGVNISLGVTTGFFGLRGIVYRAKAQSPNPADRLIRWVAGGFTAVGVGVMATMHLAAAKVRVSGSHSDIWDGGLSAAFSDYNALTLLVVGLLSSLIAAREGWGSFSDPIWGYARNVKETEDHIKDAIDQAFDEGAARLDEALDTSLDMLDALVDDTQAANEDCADDIEALHKEIAHFNADIDLITTRLKAAQAEENKRRQYLAGFDKKVEPVSLDLKALQALTIDEALIPPTSSRQVDADRQFARIEDAHEAASAELEAAYAAASSLTTLPFLNVQSLKQEDK